MEYKIAFGVLVAVAALVCAVRWYYHREYKARLRVKSRNVKNVSYDLEP